MSDRGALTLGERLEVEAAIDAAFEPLREMRTDLSPLRVRAAVRWGRAAPRPSPQALRWSGAIARLSELSIAVGMSVVIFTGALGTALDDRSVAEPTSIPAKALTRTLLEQEREIRASRIDWLHVLRERLDALHSIPLQDWLDPNVVRPVIRRLELPGPGAETAGQRGPY